jgi:hypothetical protein
MIFPEFDRGLNTILSNAGYLDRNSVLSDFAESAVKFLKLPNFGRGRLSQLTAVAISNGYLVESPRGHFISRSMASKEITRVDNEIEDLEKYKKKLEALICS